MKDRMERLVVLPFTAGCVSSSSVSVCIHHERRPKEQVGTVCRSMEMVKDLNGTSNAHMMKGLSKLPILSKPNINIGLHRLIRTMKSLSQSLVFKEEMDELETEMEIGLPTDVKHVTHIGFDGPLTPTATRTINNLTVSQSPDSEATHNTELAVNNEMILCA
ncbi:CRIB domain-containing protein RIC4 [Rutidosis leptorrhynchoides]|uniref:CRIB domain-containing protein RIC4 n=1 Tax=Rutidosis leptorrhynchoides TaxID=125765 RepID=UPI003A99B128